MLFFYVNKEFHPRMSFNYDIVMNMANINEFYQGALALTRYMPYLKAFALTRYMFCLAIVFA